MSEVGFGVGNVLATTFRIWGRNFPRFFLVVLIFQVPLVGWYLLQQTAWGAKFIYENFYARTYDLHPAWHELLSARWIVNAIAMSTLAVCTVALLRGERVSIWRGMGASFRRAHAIILAALVILLATTGVITFVAVLIWSAREYLWRGYETYIASMLVWVLLSSFFFPAIAATVVERRGAFSGVWRGVSLGRSHRWKVIAITLCGQVLVVALNLLVFQLIVRWDDGDSYRWRIELYGWIWYTIDVVLAMLWGTAHAVVFEKLRAAHEGPTPSQLHAVFD